MHNSNILCILLFVFVISCSQTTKFLEEPVDENSFLVIGSVVVEDDFYTPQSGVHLKDIEVAILAEIDEDGNRKTTGYWTKTDENGYFYLINVPPGKYTLTGVRLILNNQSTVVISNPCTSETDVFKISPIDHIGFIGNYFDVFSNNRVVNLQNNYFSIDADSHIYYDVKYFRRNAITGLRLVNGTKLIQISPISYFKNQFAGSSWAELLRESE